MFENSKLFAKHVLVGSPVYQDVKKEIKIYKDQFILQNTQMTYYWDSDSNIEYNIVEFLAGGLNMLQSKPDWLINLLSKIKYKLLCKLKLNSSYSNAENSTILMNRYLFNETTDDSEDPYSITIADDSDVIFEHSLMDLLFDYNQTEVLPQSEQEWIERLDENYESNVLNFSNDSSAHVEHNILQELEEFSLAEEFQIENPSEDGVQSDSSDSSSEFSFLTCESDLDSD